MWMITATQWSLSMAKKIRRLIIMIKYQVRIHDTMSDKPASEVFDSYDEALVKLAEVKYVIATTWATPDVSAAYISEVRTYA